MPKLVQRHRQEGPESFRDVVSEQRAHLSERFRVFQRRLLLFAPTWIDLRSAATPIAAHSRPLCLKVAPCSPYSHRPRMENACECPRPWCKLASGSPANGTPCAASFGRRSTSDAASGCSEGTPQQNMDAPFVHVPGTQLVRRQSLLEPPRTPRGSDNATANVPTCVRVLAQRI